jgi:hypothetical protein
MKWIGAAKPQAVIWVSNMRRFPMRENIFQYL